MADNLLQITNEGHVACIQMQGDWGDAETVAFFAAQLAELCKRAAEDPQVRLVVLAGMDEDAFALKDQALPTELAGILPAPAELVAGLELPVIGCCVGEASGLGLEMFMACDLRICAPESNFSLPQIKAGMMPSDGGTQLLPRLVGKALALEMLLTGESISAQKALDRGLVNRLAPAGEALAASMALAHEMATRAPIAMRYVKEAVVQGLDLSLAQGLRLEADLYLHLHTTQDRREGITTFQEKKKPHFTGE